MKALQLLSDEALACGQKMSTEEILRFLEEFRVMYAASASVTSLELPGEVEASDKPTTRIIKC
jgi:hypothetical protein